MGIRNHYYPPKKMSSRWIATSVLCFGAIAPLLGRDCVTQRARPAHEMETTLAEGIPPRDRSLIRVETTVVTLDITVTDKKGHAVSGLSQHDFVLYEDKTRQQIAFFSDEQRPASWGLVLDRSGSMRRMMEDVYRAALHSIEAGTPQDEFFLTTFNGDVHLDQDFTSNHADLAKSVRLITAEGSTALFDALAQALEHLKRSRNQKKVLVVVTDGEDTASHTTFREVVQLARESDSLIYAVGFFDSMNRGSFRGSGGRAQLERLAGETGGTAYFPTTTEDCARAFRRIAEQVSRQYSLAYYPSNTRWDGKWREIKVTLNGPKRFRVAARRGYFAPHGIGK